MLSKDELLDLAESIKTDGQHKPIVLDSDGVLLDGRNRLAACELAGIEPRFTTYTGRNPVAVILGGNLRRRHISKGQQAMIIAMASRSVSGHSLRHHAKLHGLSRSRLSAANVVLQYAPDLAEQVRTGTLNLDTAYNAARERKAIAEALQERYDRLREHAPDLADQVTEGVLTLDDATTALNQRQEEARLRQHVKDTDALRLADGDTTPPLTELAEQGHITWHQAHQQADEYRTRRQDTIHRTRQAIERIAENWTAIQNLADRPDTPYAREVIDSLTPQARTVLSDLIKRA
ncbi:plasmid replication/partition related protein [Streptomyces fradiae]